MGDYKRLDYYRNESRDVMRYGEILADENYVAPMGAVRNTTYLYNGKKWFVTMLNGEVLCAKED